MAARNNRPRMGFPKPEQGAAAQEERDMWERVKVDMMRANGLKKQSDELEKQLVQMKARIGGDWKSRYKFDDLSHFAFCTSHEAYCGLHDINHGPYLTMLFPLSRYSAIPLLRYPFRQLV